MRIYSSLNSITCSTFFVTFEPHCLGAESWCWPSEADPITAYFPFAIFQLNPTIFLFS